MWEITGPTCLQDVTTGLDEYVHREDGAFTWEEIGSYEMNVSTVYFINMTSQVWMDGKLQSFVFLSIP